MFSITAIVIIKWIVYYFRVVTGSLRQTSKEVKTNKKKETDEVTDSMSKSRRDKIMEIGILLELYSGIEEKIR